MKIIDLVQGSKEWLEFRRDKVGASDVSAVMGISPWKTPYQLYCQKIEGIEDPLTPAMEKGIELEPVARALLCKKLGINMQPLVGVSEERPWQFASFDAVSEDRTVTAEIKCGGFELYQKALRGEIPTYYMCQLHYQGDVAIPKKHLYCCFYENNLKILEVDLDVAYIRDLREKAYEFWKMLMQKEPPELLERDYDLFEHERGSELLGKYKLGSDMEKEGKRLKDEARDTLIELGPKRNFIINGTKVYKATTTSYDVARMKEHGIDVDMYKKISNPYWRISSPRSKAS